LPAGPARRLLTADHQELAGILRTGVNDLFRHIVPRTGTAANVRALVAGLRVPGQGSGSEASPPHPAVDRGASWSSVLELLQWTVSEAVGVPGIVIRSYQPQSNKLEIQLVARSSRELERFHCELPRRWRWPSRARADQVFTRVGSKHLPVQSFGEIERDQEIYVAPLEGSACCAYLAILPWTNDDRITIALGLWLADGEAKQTDDAYPRAMSELHAQAAREVAQFALPTLDETSRGVHYLLDYNWVVTKAYAGPDRRKEDTSLVNRYMLVGRRKTLARNVGEKVGGFVDGIPSWVGQYFVLYALLATVDTFCTSTFVSTGRVVELNPILAPLIADHPWLFVLAKNAFAAAAFAVVVRFHVFPRARHVLRASIGAYALLDVYWAVLLLGPVAR